MKTKEAPVQESLPESPETSEKCPNCAVLEELLANAEAEKQAALQAQASTFDSAYGRIRLELDAANGQLTKLLNRGQAVPDDTDAAHRAAVGHTFPLRR